MSEPAVAAEPLVHIEGLSKRYRIGRRVGAVPVPKIFGYAPPDANLKSRGPIDEDEDEDEDEEDEEHEGPSRDVWALRDISFDIAAGQSVGIVGTNGSGKTTLLKILGRITPPTEGRVVLRGRIAPLLELASGFMQPEMTGADNVRLLARLYGIQRAIVERRMDEVFEFAELGDFKRAQVKRYSSGMSRRLAFSVALNVEPDILLSDGILGVGDAVFRQRCFDRVKELNGQGLAVLFASHETEVVRELCSEVVWLEEGAIRRRGPVEDVLREYEALYGGPEQPAGSAPTMDDQAAARAVRARSKLHIAREKAVETEFNDFAVLLDTRIVSPEGERVHALARDEQAVVEVEAELMQPAPIIVKVIFSGQVGLRRRLRSPENWRVERAGRVTARVELPPGSLPGGRYTATVAVWVVVDGRRSRVMRPAAFTFDVDETDDDDQQLPQLEGPVRGARNWRLAVD